MLANLHRDTKRRPEPYGMLDFLPWRNVPTATEPILVEDKDAQAQLLSVALFGKRLP